MEFDEDTWDPSEGDESLTYSEDDERQSRHIVFDDGSSSEEIEDHSLIADDETVGEDDGIIAFDDGSEEEAADDPSEDGSDLEYPDVYYLPILFCIDKKGDERMWKVWTEDATVKRLQGLIKGKKQTYERTFQGKNLGKKNETTPEEQAKQSAETMWTKQIDKGYYPKCKEGKAMLKKIQNATADTGGHNINAGASIRGRKPKATSKVEDCKCSVVNVNITPMKAEKWELADTSNPKSVLPKVLKYFNLTDGLDDDEPEDSGVYVQYKLDGWRCVSRLQEGPQGLEVAMTTNNKKQFGWFAHLRSELQTFLVDPKRRKLALDGLDGEIYAHRLVDENGSGMDDTSRFQTITKICSLTRKEPHPLETQVSFVVFDIIDLSGKFTQDERFRRLDELFTPAFRRSCPHIVRCNTKLVHCLEDIVEYHDEAAQEGYEGVIIRARDMKYSQKRNYSMRKYKNFLDREYPIIDVKKDEGVEDKYFVWVCQDPDIIDPETDEPMTFSAKPTGCDEDREYWYENYLEYIGKNMTVKFQEYTEDGIPRFPIALGIREDQ